MSLAASSIFLTGGTGFLGARVVRQMAAAQAPARLVLATHRASLPPELASPAVTSVAMDLGGELRLPAGLDTVVHIAGEKRDAARMAEVNERGTRRLAEAAAAAGVRRFVYISSVGSYGAPPHAGEVTESYPHVPRNAYEASKDAGETAVRQVCAQAGMEAVIVQPTNVIGLVPGKSHPLLGLMRMVARRRFAWFGAGDPLVNYVGVDDAAAAIVAATARAPAGTYIVNTPCRLADLVGWVAAELRMPAPSRRLPAWLGRALAGAGGLAAAASGRSMPFGPERLLELTNTTRYAPESLMRATGFAYPTGIEPLIRELARHYVHEELV